jgi:hypothetical protein
MNASFGAPPKPRARFSVASFSGIEGYARYSGNRRPLRSADDHDLTNTLHKLVSHPDAGKHDVITRCAGKSSSETCSMKDGNPRHQVIAIYNNRMDLLAHDFLDLLHIEKQS